MLSLQIMAMMETIGNESMRALMASAVREGRVSHAQMIVAPDGYGALAVAIEYACSVLGIDRGSIFSCPDLHFAYPVNTTKDIKKDPVSDDFAPQWRQFVGENLYGSLRDWYQMIDIENKQGNISIREAEKIASKLSLKSYGGGYRVMIIWHGEKMNNEAANKLLKLIEEPGEKTLILLVTADAGAILPTIASRMQAVELRRPARSDIETFLQERGVDRDTAGVIARECDGDVGRALELSMGQDDDSPYGELFVRFVRSAFMAKKNAGELNNLMAWADDVARLPRESQKQFIQYVYGVFRAALMSSYGLEAMGRVGGLPQGFNFASFCNYVHSRNIRAIYDLLSDAAFHIERNASPRLTFMDMAVKITRLLHTKAV